MRTSSSIKEELRRFRLLKRSQGLLEMKPSFFGNTSSISASGNQQQFSKPKSPIFISDEVFFTNPVLSDLLSPHTASRLEIVKKMDVSSDWDRQENNLNIYEDKENTQSQANKAERAKINNRYTRAEQVALSRNTLFATDKSCDLVEQKMRSGSRGVKNVQEQKEEKYSQTATFTLNESNDKDQRFNSTLRDRWQNSSYGSKNLDSELIKFYQNLKTKKEQQPQTIKEQRSNSVIGQERLQIEDEKEWQDLRQEWVVNASQNSKPPKRRSMSIKTDLTDEWVKKEQKKNYSSCRYNNDEFQKEVFLSLTAVNQLKGQNNRSSQSIEIRRLNLFEEQEMKSKLIEQSKQLKSMQEQIYQQELTIRQLTQQNQQFQQLQTQLQQHQQVEQQHHSMQVNMLQDRIRQLEQQQNHLEALQQLQEAQMRLEDPSAQSVLSNNQNPIQFQYDNQSSQLEIQTLKQLLTQASAENSYMAQELQNLKYQNIKGLAFDSNQDLDNNTRRTAILQMNGGGGKQQLNCILAETNTHLTKR